MRQAIVVIHGMGEQRPMSTLRGFVRALSGENGKAFLSKPDRMSESFELRRLVAGGTRSRPVTDFYEYYWAYRMEGTKLRHIWPWFRGILLRMPHKVPASLRTLWVLSWLLIGGAAYLLMTGRLGLPGNPLSERGSTFTAGILAVMFVVVQGFAVKYLGDAARYLSPRPANIAIRHSIRSEGIELIRRMHSSGSYNRIVVVGHSLGSVIAYDVLTHLWDQYNTIHETPVRPSQDALKAVEKTGRGLPAHPPKSDAERFRSEQRQLWLELRRLGNPWLVTDLVTMGSPLAHAGLLLAKDESELRERQEQRELPRCPPVLDANRYSYRSKYTVEGFIRSVQVLHHAALFACTRWTNIYFPVRVGLLGDWVGGPLQAVFGPGILDVPITSGWPRFFPLVGHVKYWRGKSVGRRPGSTTALGCLRSALALDSSRWLVLKDNPNTTA